MLLLTKTVERKVSCNYTRHHYKCRKGWLRDSEALGTEKCPICGNTDHPGHSIVVYQVESEVLLHTYKDEALSTGIAICMSTLNESVRSPKGCQFHYEVVQGFAEAILTAYLADEDLPGVTVTEILPDSDEEDEYTIARHGERVEELPTEPWTQGGLPMDPEVPSDD